MFWTYVSIVIAVVFGILSVYLYFAGRKEKAPVYSYKSIDLIGKNPELPEDIEILHKGIPVPRVCRTRLLFWNRGRQTIDEKDVVGKVSVNFPSDVKILREPVIKALSRVQIGILASYSDNIVNLDFAFLDRDDGALIEVLHTGDSKSTIAVEGTIKGVRQGIQYSNVLARRRSLGSIAGALYILVSSLALLFFVIRVPSPPPRFGELLPALVFLGSMAVLGLFVLYRELTAKRPPSWAGPLY